MGSHVDFESMLDGGHIQPTQPTYESELGNGIYLAKNADFVHYGNDGLFQNKVPNSENIYKMIMVRAAIGISQQVELENIDLPKKEEQSKICDSIKVISEDTEKIDEYKQKIEDESSSEDHLSLLYVVPSSDQVYPEYLITYTVVEPKNEGE